MMKCLYFAAHPLWPVTSGARLRNYELARQLAGRASVDFVEMRNVGGQRGALPENSNLASILTLEKGRTYTPAKLLRGLIGPTPVTLWNCWSPRAAAQLAEVLHAEEFDAVQVSGTPLQPYLPVVQRARGRPTLVVDWHNIESELMARFAESTGNWAKKIAAKRTAKLIERAEDRLLEMDALHTVTSERERQKLLARRPRANIAVIPNGVDSRFFAATKAPGASHGNGSASKPAPAIVFVGSMDYHANVDAVLWFCRTAWPEIAQSHPGLQFTIAGRDPSPAVRALASERIHVTGTVDDLRPYYARAVASVAPVRIAGGTRLKILEAMAAGVPVVSTRLGVEGLDVEAGVHFLPAENGREMAAGIAQIIASSETASRLAQAARALVCACYDWDAIGERLWRIHSGLAEARERRGRRILVSSDLPPTRRRTKVVYL